MNATYLAITGVTIALLIAVSIPDYIPAGFVIKNSAEVDVPRSWLPRLATLKLAGAAGLLIGLIGYDARNHAVSVATQAVWAASGVGLVVFFLGAVIFHVRARALHNIWFPAVFLVLAVSSLIVAIAH